LNLKIISISEPPCNQGKPLKQSILLSRNQSNTGFIYTSDCNAKFSFKSKCIFLSSFDIRFARAFDVVVVVGLAAGLAGEGLRMLFFGDKTSNWLFRDVASESSFSSELLRKLVPTKCRKYSLKCLRFNRLEIQLKSIINHSTVYKERFWILWHYYIYKN